MYFVREKKEKLAIIFDNLKSPRLCLNQLCTHMNNNILSFLNMRNATIIISRF